MSEEWTMRFSCEMVGVAVGHSDEERRLERVGQTRGSLWLNWREDGLRRRGGGVWEVVVALKGSQIAERVFCRGLWIVGILWRRFVVPTALLGG